MTVETSMRETDETTAPPSGAPVPEHPRPSVAVPIEVAGTGGSSRSAISTSGTARSGPSGA